MKTQTPCITEFGLFSFNIPFQIPVWAGLFLNKFIYIYIYVYVYYSLNLYKVLISIFQV